MFRKTFHRQQSYDGKTETQKEKAKVRNTKAWADLKKAVINRYWGKDPVTKAPLRKGWNLHHCDLRKENYGDLTPEKFLPLNERTHEFVHWLYSYYQKDVRVLDRIKMVMEIMATASAEVFIHA